MLETDLMKTIFDSNFNVQDYVHWRIKRSGRGKTRVCHLVQCRENTGDFLMVFRREQMLLLWLKIMLRRIKTGEQKLQHWTMKPK